MQEDAAVGLERDASTILVRLAHHRHWVQRLAALVFLTEYLTLTVDLSCQMCRQCVDAAHADAVQTAGDLVGALVELTACMEHRQNDFQGRTLLLLVHARGDTTTIVEHADGVTFQNIYCNPIAIASHGLVDRVVNYFVNQVMQAPEMNVADVHGRAFAHCLKAFQNLNLIGTVFFAC